MEGTAKELTDPATLLATGGTHCRDPLAPLLSAVAPSRLRNATIDDLQAKQIVPQNRLGDRDILACHG